MDIERWNLLVSHSQENEKVLVSLLETGKNGLVAAEYNLYLHNINFAYYSICVEKDYERALNYFYKSAMLAIKTIHFSQSREEMPLESCLSLLFPAILCGEPKIFAYFMSNNILHPLGEQNYPATYSFIKCLQFTMKKEFSSAEKWLLRVEKYTQKHWVGGKNYALFIRGVIYNDKKLIEESIQYFLKNRKSTFNDMKCFAIESAFFLKICYILNIKIDLNLSLAPKLLIEMPPLEHYSGYSFFRSITAHLDAAT